MQTSYCPLFASYIEVNACMSSSVWDYIYVQEIKLNCIHVLMNIINLQPRCTILIIDNFFTENFLCMEGILNLAVIAQTNGVIMLG